MLKFRPIFSIRIGADLTSFLNYTCKRIVKPELVVHANVAAFSLWKNLAALESKSESAK
jgi:hypothetical protein